MDSRRPAGPERARERLRRLNVRAAKGLGQHFLVDRDVLETIVTAADLGPADTVLEVGPGLGILTGELVKRAGKVLAIEVDTRLASALERQFAGCRNLSVVSGDILDHTPRDLLGGPHEGYKVVANLPYYVAAPILRHFLEASHKPEVMVVMVQKEVAESIAAGPGQMSLLGVSVQLYGRPRIVDYVAASSFHPRPKVDSAILRIDVYPEPAVDLNDIDEFFEVVRAGFSSPRKQLRNSLSLGLQMEAAEVARLLEQVGLAPQRRPQTLSLDEWAGLACALAGKAAR